MIEQAERQTSPRCLPINPSQQQPSSLPTVQPSNLVYQSSNLPAFTQPLNLQASRLPIPYLPPVLPYTTFATNIDNGCLGLQGPGQWPRDHLLQEACHGATSPRDHSFQSGFTLVMYRLVAYLHLSSQTFTRILGTFQYGPLASRPCFSFSFHSSTCRLIKSRIAPAFPATRQPDHLYTYHGTSLRQIQQGSLPQPRGQAPPTTAQTVISTTGYLMAG